MGLLIFLNQDMIEKRRKLAMKNRSPIFLCAVVFWLNMYVVPYFHRTTHYLRLSNDRTTKNSCLETKSLMGKYVWPWHQNFDSSVSSKLQSHSPRATGFESEHFLSQVSSCKNIFSFSASQSTITNSAVFTARTWNIFLFLNYFLFLFASPYMGARSLSMNVPLLKYNSICSSGHFRCCAVPCLAYSYYLQHCISPRKLTLYLLAPQICPRYPEVSLRHPTPACQQLNPVSGHL